MKNNSFVKAKLIDILNIIDARARVEIYISYEDGTNAILRGCLVYEILADTSFISNFANYNVIGITLDLYTKILIKED